VFQSKSFLASLTDAPGIYQMLDAQGHVLYVGKARNLKKRLSSYFHKTLSQPRLISLVQQIDHIDVIVTRNENEALLLENQLIKKHLPRYNILLRDDKSFPYIVMSEHEYPRLLAKRGERHGSKDDYFGPYPSAMAVRETIKLMQNVFKLRVCRDSFFRHRSRPCLLYQIKKCTAPCVGHINNEDYLRDVKNAKLLLSGKNDDLLKVLIHDMEQAAAHQDYEVAAKIRDQLTSLRHIQTQQVVTTGKGNSDVFKVVVQHGVIAVQALFIRNGHLLGNQIFYPRVPEGCSTADILEAFIPQFYLDHEVPDEIVLQEKLPEQSWILNALRELRGKKINLITAARAERAQWLAMADKTARQAINTKIASASQYSTRLQVLQQLLQLPVLPERMECFDISHSFGEATVASCVVFDRTGPLKSAYRRFNIVGVPAGDDYAAIHQALTRRYKKIKSGEEKLPDILFIDGGKGQLHQAEKVLQEIGIENLTVVAIAKGTARKPGWEQLFVPGKDKPLAISGDSPALHLIQQIRDEAHRFAITGHRQKRSKARNVSPLEGIPGIGPKKRRELLRNLGGLQEVKRASIEELQKVPGISRKIAELIYAACR
jgi:excinuclease ABC subunit C